jgi:uncharacterized membrane protein
MPKKTRQEKIIAQLRRQLQSQNTIATGQQKSLSQIIQPTRKKSAVNSYSLNHVAFDTQNHKNQKPIDPVNHDYALSDMKRIISITLLAFIFEIALYFFMNLNGFSKFLQIFKK